MEKLFKKIWRSFPDKVKYKLRSKIIFIIKTIYNFLGFQYLDHDTGRVSVPYFTKSKLKKSFAQQGEDLILDRIITRVLGLDINKPRNYVDVGAFDAVEHSVTYLLYLRDWRGIVFDPSTKTRKSFEFWRKKDVFVNAVVGEEDGVNVDFFIRKDADDDQSLNNTKYPSRNKLNTFKKIIHRQVNLNNELRRQGVSKISVLKIDVEGAELEILKTLDFELFKPSIISIEIHGNNIEKCLETEEAKLILNKGYQIAGSAVITHFFVRIEEVVK